MKADSAPRPRVLKGPRKRSSIYRARDLQECKQPLREAGVPRHVVGMECEASRGPGLPWSSLCGLQQLGGGGLGVPKIKMKNKKIFPRTPRPGLWICNGVHWGATAL